MDGGLTDAQHLLCRLPVGVELWIGLGVGNDARQVYSRDLLGLRLGLRLLHGCCLRL